MIALTDKLLRFVKVFLLVLLGLYLYSLLMASNGGFTTEFLHLQWLEMVFLLYLYEVVSQLFQGVRYRGVGDGRGSALARGMGAVTALF